MTATRHLIVLGACLLVCASPVACRAATGDPQAFARKEMLDYVTGLGIVVQMADPYNTEFGDVIKQLEGFSSKHFDVGLYQKGKLGEACAGGIIFIDVAELAKPKDVLAYVLAHEWGHLALGQQPTIYTVMAGQWARRPYTVESERAADEYAGQFLAAFGYDVDEVAAFVRSMPTSDRTHEDPEKRAERITRAFRDYRKKNEGVEWKTRKTLCVHFVHFFDLGPAGPAPCTHAWHPDGDTTYYKAQPATFTLFMRRMSPYEPTPLALATIWIDGVEVGTVYNNKEPYSVDVDQFEPGRHSYRVRVIVTTIDVMTFTWEKRGHLEVKDGARFRVAGNTNGTVTLEEE